MGSIWSIAAIFDIPKAKRKQYLAKFKKGIKMKQNNIDGALNLRECVNPSLLPLFLEYLD